MKIEKRGANINANGAVDGGKNGLITMDPAADAGERTGYSFIIQTSHGLSVIESGHLARKGDRKLLKNLLFYVKHAVKRLNHIISLGSVPTGPRSCTTKADAGVPSAKKLIG
jgi:hypothetical protein